MKRIRVALDSNLSGRLVGALDALYGHHGFEFTHISTFSSPRDRDEMWADTYKRFGGKIVISGDSKIAVRPHEAVAFIDNGFISFFPPKAFGEMRGHERAAVILHQFPAMLQIIERENTVVRGSCWRFACQGKKGLVRLDNSPIIRVEMPEDVLNTTARRKAGT